MPVVPEVQLLLDNLAGAGGPALETMAPAQARAMFDALALMPNTAPEVPSHDTTVEGVGVRVYDPAGSDPAGPTLVWYHGGGWVIGNLGTVDPLCRHLASRTSMRIVSVDYRLAPEHPFPAAADDSFAVLAAVAAGALGGPPPVVAVGGDSAGGNLAAVVSLMARDRGGPAIALQVLGYPVIDATMSSGSYKDNAEGYFLSAAAMSWFYDLYAPGAVRDEPYVSPIRAASLTGLPAAVVLTAEFDPLRDEGEAYAGALKAAGVDTVALRYDGLIHGFLSMPELCGPTAMGSLDTIAKALLQLR